MVVICRIELDSLDLIKLEHLVADKIVTLSDARKAKAVTEMSEYAQVLWVRKMQAIRDRQQYRSAA